VCGKEGGVRRPVLWGYDSPLGWVRSQSNSGAGPSSPFPLLHPPAPRDVSCARRPKTRQKARLSPAVSSPLSSQRNQLPSGLFLVMTKCRSIFHFRLDDSSSWAGGGERELPKIKLGSRIRSANHSVRPVLALSAEQPQAPEDSANITSLRKYMK
jgi:hypothetical protein